MVDGDVVDGVRGLAACVEHDVGDQGAVEVGFEPQVVVHVVGYGCAEVGVAVADVDGCGVVAVDLDEGRVGLRRRICKAVTEIIGRRICKVCAVGK